MTSPGRVVALSVVRPGAARRWALVAVLATVAVLVPQVPAWLPASATAVDPDTLRDRILASAGLPHQGYAEITGSLALPELPRLEDVTSLLTTTTRVRSWYVSPSRWRFDVISGVGERDVYRTVDGEFTWDYGANLLTWLVGDPPVRLPRAGDLLPPQLARGRCWPPRTTRCARCPPAGSPGTARRACGSPRPTRTPPSGTSTCGRTRTPACRSRSR